MRWPSPRRRLRRKARASPTSKAATRSILERVRPIRLRNRLDEIRVLEHLDVRVEERDVPALRVARGQGVVPVVVLHVRAGRDLVPDPARDPPTIFRVLFLDEQ